jgi:uncharacterized protein (TIGR03437 family)
MHLRIAAVLTVSVACSAMAQTYTMKTFAGGALPVNVAGLSASLGEVNGMAVDGLGNVYLSLGDYNIVVRCAVDTGVLALVAGNGISGFAGDGGTATSAELANPAGLALDGAGNLYVADSGNNRIRQISNGVITTIAGNGSMGYSGDNGPALNAQFNGIGALALDTAGNIYVADFYNQVIRKIAGGMIITVAGNGTYGYSGDKGPATSAQLAGPSGIAVDYLGNLYIAEGYNNSVRKVSNGVITTIAGTGVAGYSGDYGPAAAAMLREPTDLSMDSLSNLYIADYGNNRIRRVTFSGSVISTVVGTGAPAYSGEHVSATSCSLLSPQHLAIDASGNIYIVDSNHVRKVSNGMIVTTEGGGVPLGENGPAANAQLASPQGLTMDSAGNLFIADAGTGRVLKVSGGTLSRVAGTGTAGAGSLKSQLPATSVQLGQPMGVAVSPTGDFYITDPANLVLLKVSNGILSTAAGGGGALGDGGPAVAAQFTNPQAITMDPGGNLYLTDLNRVRMISNGIITTVAGNGLSGYQGDGGLATAAYISNPSGVAIDNSGNLYFADLGNNRVRMVSNGIVTTVAGNGTYGFTGSGGTATSAELGNPAGVATDSAGNFYITDGERVMKVTKGKTNIISTIGGLQNPQGIAVDSAGNVYVAEPATHRVREFSPATGTTCAMTVTPANPQALIGGGSLTINIQTGATCSWAVESLPAWLSVSANPFGVGPGSVTFAVAANNDAPRTATILAGGQNLVIAQAGAMTITGQVTSSTSATQAIQGVTLNLSGAKSLTATSDSGGYFSFSGFGSTGTFTVTPSLAGYAFVPVSQTFTNATANPAANFTAWLLPQIAGVGPVFGSTLVPAPSGFAAGETISIYGSNLCTAPTSAVPTLPDRLASCFVLVDGVNLHVYYASAVQVNAVLPQTITAGAHQLTVQRYTDTGYKTMAAQSPSFSLTVNPAAMAFAERTDNGNQILLAQYTDGTFAGSAKPVQAGQILILYLTGLGRTAQTFTEGAAPKTASAAVTPIQVTVQGLTTQVLYDGVQPTYPGIDQINLTVPKYTLPAGTNTVTVQVSAPSANQTITYQLNAK